MHVLVHPLVTIKIIAPPQNVTVCKNSDVTIRCGYQSNTSLPTVWVIDGVQGSEEDISSNIYPSWKFNNRSNPLGYSMTQHSIKWITTFQCGIKLTPNITIYSTRGTVTVVGTYAIICCTYLQRLSIA